MTFHSARQRTLNDFTFYREMFHDSSTIDDSLGCMEVSFTHRSVWKTLLSRKVEDTSRPKVKTQDLKSNEMVHGLMISILSLLCLFVQFTTSKMKLY